MRVPDRLRDRIGLQEVCKSLQTYSPTLARRLAASVSAKVMETFAMIDEITNVPPDEARKLIQACFAEVRREIDALPPYIPETDLPDLELSEQISLAQDCICRLTGELENRAPSIGTERAASDAMARRGIDLKSIAPEGRARLLNGFTRILIERQRMITRRLLDPLAEYQPQDAIFLQGQAVLSTASNMEIGPTVGQAVSEYLAAKSKVWIPKTARARAVHLGYFVDFIGAEHQLTTVSELEIRSFRNALVKLRANHGRRKHLSFQERLTENAAAQIKDKTAALIFEPIKAFFRWAFEDDGLLKRNPASSVRWQSAKVVKGVRSRRPFEPAELETLFSSPVFTGSKSPNRRFEIGSMVVKDAKFWLPILAYYTGARLGELVQIHISDVNLAGDIPHLDFNESHSSGDRKHVKSAAAIRRVPLHPDILEMGFAAFVEQRRKWNKPSKRLFSEVNFGTDGQASTQASKAFARMFDKVGLSDPTLTFHSFRHGAADAFRDAQVPQYVIDSIMGHSDGKVSSHYGKGPSLQTKAEAVLAMGLPLSLPKLCKAREES